MNGKPSCEELEQSIKELDKKLSDKDHLINALEKKLRKFEMISEAVSSGDEKIGSPYKTVQVVKKMLGILCKRLIHA